MVSNKINTSNCRQTVLVAKISSMTSTAPRFRYGILFTPRTIASSIIRCNTSIRTSLVSVFVFVEVDDDVDDPTCTAIVDAISLFRSFHDSLLSICDFSFSSSSQDDFDLILWSEDLPSHYCLVTPIMYERSTSAQLFDHIYMISNKFPDREFNLNIININRLD